MRQKKNVMPEIGWSQLRHRFTPGFEDILDIGVTNGWYDPSVLLEALVFRWVFIPWLQQELSAYRYRVNNTAKQADRQIKVEPAFIEEVREQFAPRDNEVFELVPPDFHAIIAQIYVEIGEPPITRGTCWDVYRQLLDIDAEWGYAMAGDEHANDIDLTPGLQPLRNGDNVVGANGFYYMGGVNGGQGLDEEHSIQLDQMLDADEPPVVGSDAVDSDDEILVWFSDEDFADGSDVDEW
ncbi:hypothetical protein C8R46DRAFT_1199641 [Mycena filopes]|nr:hypothetical protein C8R46DRAFT_1199641 [Mycena filopes]